MPKSVNGLPPAINFEFSADLVGGCLCLLRRFFPIVLADLSVIEQLCNALLRKEYSIRLRVLIEMQFLEEEPPIRGDTRKLCRLTRHLDSAVHRRRLRLQQGQSMPSSNPNSNLS